MKNKLIYILALGLFVSSFTACTKKFDEINTDPNKPTDVPVTTILAFAIQEHAAQFYNTWGDMNEPSTYAGQLAKHSYIDESRYAFRPNVVENLWTYASRELKNLELGVQRSKEEGNLNMQAASLTIQTMIWMVATDRWRDIPFVDALKGDEGFITTPYTKQEDIYPVLLERLKEAADLFNEDAGDDLGAGDLLFSDSSDPIGEWKKFANSLRLRAAIRISDVAPALARQHIEEIIGNPAKYPIMDSNEDNALVTWPGSAPYQEPWQADAGSRDDYSMAVFLIDELKGLDDPRLPVYALPTTNTSDPAGTYRGAPVGPSNAEVAGIASNTYSRIGNRFRNDPRGFSPFMRASEVQFILAEAAQKGWSVGISAADAYNEGVTLSMLENGIAQDDIDTYLNGSGKFNNTLNEIYLQKWISLFKNGQEAWAESRRTDVPVMPAASGSRYPGHNRPPFRYPYPTTETQLNNQNSAEYVAKVKDNFWGQQMWWDTRTGVQ